MWKELRYTARAATTSVRLTHLIDKVSGRVAYPVARGTLKYDTLP